MMTKNDIIGNLIKDPKRDSEWIASVAEIIIHNYKDEKYTDDDAMTDINEFKYYNAGQLQVIKEGILSTTNPYNLIKEIESYNYNTPAFEFNATQLQLLGIFISYMISNKSDEDFPKSDQISKLFDNSIPYARLNFVIKGITEGYYDMIDYIDFEPDQICEIYAGHKDNIDYKKYAHKRIPDNIMGVIRYAMNNNLKYIISDRGDIRVEISNK